jgi:DNA polymerase I-like protein with 3'-5' exonuclease and polymerase domains
MKYVPVDIETINTRPDGGVVWIIAVGRTKKIELIHDCNGIREVPQWFIDLMADEETCKILHNAAFDGSYLGVNLLAPKTYDKKRKLNTIDWMNYLGIPLKNVWDTMLSEQVILGIRLDYKEKREEVLKALGTGLQYVLPRYKLRKKVDKSTRERYIDRPLGKKFDAVELQYPKDDVSDLPALARMQQQILVRDNLMEVALLENKTVEKVIQMKVKGIGFDTNIWEQVALDNLKEYHTRLSRLPHQVQNWNSPKQVLKFFNSIGLNMTSTAVEDVVETYLATENPILGQYAWAKQLHKATTSYGLSWLNEDDYVDSDGRIRCDVNQIINTGRFSMSNPNLQQLPGEGAKSLQYQVMISKIKKQLGISTNYTPQHRKAFIPRKGCSFVIGDFSGQEMGIMAANANEKIWIDALLRGDDIHAVTASLLYQHEWEHAKSKGCKFPKKCDCPGHKQLRLPTKVLNFMLAYGGGPTKFAADTGIDIPNAMIIVRRYKGIVQNTTDWLNKNGRDALATGEAFSADPYRRRRVLTGEENWQVENQGKNTPVQSAGANMLKLAMISIPDEFPIVLVIHDEIILEVENKHAKKAAKMLKTVMEESADYITGIKGLIRVTPRITQNIMKEGGIEYKNGKFV